MESTSPQPTMDEVSMEYVLARVRLDKLLRKFRCCPFVSPRYGTRTREERNAALNRLHSLTLANVLSSRCVRGPRYAEEMREAVDDFELQACRFCTGM